MSENKMPKCPNCKEQMVIIWYYVPDEVIKNFVDEKKIFYKGLEPKELDRENPESIKYHCYNCNRSYSKDLKKHIEENTIEEIFKKAKIELNNIVDELADRVINDLDKNTVEGLSRKPQYSHFGFGLYIRNNYIYGNDKIKYRLEVDSLSHKVYDRILEKLFK